MLEGLKEALQYVVGLGNSSEKVQVLEICGETYANRRLERYGAPKRAEAVEASTLSSMVEYILRCSEEFKGNNMIIHVESPKKKGIPFLFKSRNIRIPVRKMV